MIPLTKFLSRSSTVTNYSTIYLKSPFDLNHQRFLATKSKRPIIAVPNKRVTVNPDVVPPEVMMRLVQESAQVEQYKEMMEQKKKKEELKQKREQAKQQNVEQKVYQAEHFEEGVEEEEAIEDKIAKEYDRKKKKKPTLRFNPESVKEWKGNWKKWSSKGAELSPLNLSLTEGCLCLCLNKILMCVL